MRMDDKCLEEQNSGLFLPEERQKVDQLTQKLVSIAKICWGVWKQRNEYWIFSNGNPKP